MGKISEDEFFEFCILFENELGYMLGKKENSKLLTEAGISLYQEQLIRDIVDFNMKSIDGISTSSDYIKQIFSTVKITILRIIQYNNDKNDTIVLALSPKNSEKDWEKYRFEEERVEGKLQDEYKHAYGVLENVLKLIDNQSKQIKKDI